MKAGGAPVTATLVTAAVPTLSVVGGAAKSAWFKENQGNVLAMVQTARAGGRRDTREGPRAKGGCAAPA